MIYYIDEAGNDITGDGSSGNPWASLSFACDHVVLPSNTIFVNSGTYIETNLCTLALGVSVEGVGDNSYIICHNIGDIYAGLFFLTTPGLGGSGNQSISYLKLDGANISTVAIGVHYRSDVKVHHVTIRNFITGGITFESLWRTNTDATYQTGNEIHDCNIKIDLGSGSINRATVQEGFLFYNNILDISDSTEENLTNIYTRFNKGFKFYNNKTYNPTPVLGNNKFNLVFYDGRGGCEIYNNELRGGGVLINLAGASHVVGAYEYSTYIHHNSLFGISFPSSAVNGYVTGMAIESTQEYVIIAYNIFTDFAYAISMTIGLSDKYMNNIKINYNLFYNITWTDQPEYAFPIYIYIRSAPPGLSNSWMKDIYIDNNVIAHCDVNAGIIIVSDGDMDNINIRNNIIYDISCYTGRGWLSFKPVFNSEPLGFGTIDDVNILNNIIYDCSLDNGIAEDGQDVTDLTISETINADPKFSSLDNFHLQHGSPAIDAGIDIELDFDLDGYTVGNTPCIGAYEYIVEPLYDITANIDFLSVDAVSDGGYSVEIL